MESSTGPPAQFSHQVTRLQFPKDVHFGDDISIWIAKVGDVALGNMYLRVDWPVASTVDDSAGTRMIDFVELRYENDLLERHYGESLELMNDLSVTTGKQPVLTTLLGKGLTSNLSAYYIRMPFRLNLPLCALDKAPVFRVKFRPSQEFSTLNWTKTIKVNLFVDYVYVTKAERDYFRTAKIDYLTHTIQRLQFTVDAKTSKSTFLTEFTRPVKELYWVIQNTGAAAYDFTNTGSDQLVSLRLQFNGIDVILPEIGTPLFLRTIQGLENHTRVPDRKFYMYPFALDPEHPTQPTGSVNMSTLTRQLHTLELSLCASSRQVRVYAVTHNVVRIANGAATSLFDTVQEAGTTTGGKQLIVNVLASPLFVNPGAKSFTSGGSFSVSQTASGTGPLTWSISPVTGVTLTSPSTSGVTVTVLPFVTISTTPYTLTAINAELTSCVQTFNITNTVPPGALYSFTTFTFTPAGATGSSGPTTLSAYGTSYPGYGSSYPLTLSGGIQYWTVPDNATYTFTIAGAGTTAPNSSNSVKVAYGFVLTASYALTKGTVLAILVGQSGLGFNSEPLSTAASTSGSGGSFVAIYSSGSYTPLLIAGGAGGLGREGDTDTNSQVNGSSTTSGNPCPLFPAGALPGTNGDGATGPAAYGSGGTSGGGYLTSGTKGTTVSSPGLGFLQGGTGGAGGFSGGAGGFGGGGGGGDAAGGGGGGYSGGAGSTRHSNGGGAGGGGSYDVTSSYSGSATNSGQGYVTITKV